MEHEKQEKQEKLDEYLAKYVDDDALERLRDICLAFPEASEQGGVGRPTFKVRQKIFAMRHLMDGRLSVWLKAPPGAQGALIQTSPDIFFMPPYVGRHGWVGAFLDADLDWDQLADLIEDSYRMTVPKRLVAQLDER
ncbi:MAG TPA: MmcQ/YjbR family DNA-binding protein [Ktedonobacterales bacterium]|nr:MmcQ/YjbR family DNA-binding protein [Ktedonobacterales bacterium]